MFDHRLIRAREFHSPFVFLVRPDHRLDERTKQVATKDEGSPTATQYAEFQKNLQEVMLTYNVSELVLGEPSATTGGDGGRDGGGDATSGAGSGTAGGDEDGDVGDGKGEGDSGGGDENEGFGDGDFGDGDDCEFSGCENEDDDGGNDEEHQRVSRSERGGVKGKGKLVANKKGDVGSKQQKKGRKPTGPGSLLMTSTPEKDVLECM